MKGYYPYKVEDKKLLDIKKATRVTCNVYLFIYKVEWCCREVDNGIINMEWVMNSANMQMQ